MRAAQRPQEEQAVLRPCLGTGGSVQQWLKQTQLISDQLPCNPLEPKCSPSPGCPHRGARSGEGQGTDMWDWMGQWLGRMAQVSEETLLYLVRYLLCQVIGLLHLLCYEMLRCWLGLLLQSTAQTEDTRRGSRAIKWRRQSPVMAELLPETPVRAVTPSAVEKRMLSARI